MTIPRFLLPQRGQIWRLVQPRAAGASPGGMAVAPTTPARVRLASSKTPAAKKPLVLEKPARFNPPSHGARLPNKQHTPKHYGGSLSPEALKAQSMREYPGMMAPRGTWTHWFLHNKSIHLFITLVGSSNLQHIRRGCVPGAGCGGLASGRIRGKMLTARYRRRERSQDSPCTPLCKISR